MTEPAKQFIKEVQGNEELRRKLEDLSKSVASKDTQRVQKELMQPMLALAKEYGYTLSEEDFQFSQESLSDDELTAVAGGAVGACGCMIPGIGGGAGLCACIILGEGILGPDHFFQVHTSCDCMTMGGGE